MKYLDIKGKTVLDNQGRVLGRVDSLIVDIKNLKIKCILVSNTIFFNNFYVIPYKSIKFLREFIELDKKMHKVKKVTIVKNKKNVLQNQIDKEILDSSGKKLGKLMDLIFDYTNGKFIAMISSGGFFEDLFEGRNIILINSNTKFREENIIVQVGNFTCKNEVRFKKYFKD